VARQINISAGLKALLTIENSLAKASSISEQSFVQIGICGQIVLDRSGVPVILQ
jgi:hypothetical protein